MNHLTIEGLFLAIKKNNLVDVQRIIDKDPAVLSQSYLELTPIFYAIDAGTPEIVKAIIDKDPAVLNQTSIDKGNTINYAVKQSSRALKNDKDKASEILKIILEEKFSSIPHDAQSNLEELFLNKTLLAGLYSRENMGTELKILEKAILKTLRKDSSPDSQQENPFDAIYKQIFLRVDSHNEMKDKDGKNMFIYSLDFRDHKSYFIFHVNTDNKLESISYCDGNEIAESRKIKDSSTHIHGITTFKLENSVEYSGDFAQKFIDDNTKAKPITEFYKTLKNQQIKINGAKIDYAKTEYSTPTKAQKRGNCVFKSTGLLARFLLQKKDPEMICDFDKETKKPTGKGHEEYKKFKQTLIKKTLESIKNLESKLEIEEDPESKPNSFNKYLKEEIKKTLIATFYKIWYKLLPKKEEIKKTPNTTLDKKMGKLLPKKINDFFSVISSFANCSPSFSSVRSSSTRKFHLELYDIFNGKKEEEKNGV
jgi:hypothetical protein